MREENCLNKICVIGAGVSGISVSKELHEKNVGFDCFEKTESVGGIWVFSEEKGRTSVWKGLHQNSPKGNYSFRDFPMSDAFPEFPNADHVTDYLNDYVDEFGFREHIYLNSKVTHVTRDSDGNWRVTINDEECKVYKGLVICNGHHEQPFSPEYVKNFTGEYIHSQDYHRRQNYANKKVLVIGYGNSGAQIAVDTSLEAAHTFISIRRGVYILPNYVGGLRIDKVTTLADTWWFRKLLTRAGHGWFWTKIYDLLVGFGDKSFGLEKADYFIGMCLPTRSENFRNRIGDGKLSIKKDITSISGKMVTFVDGSQEEVDAIICATGYRTVFPFIEKGLIEVKENHIPLYKRTFSVDYDNLCFVGLLQAVNWGFLPVFEVQARMVAAYYAGQFALPTEKKMNEDIHKDKTINDKELVDSLRNKYYVHGATFIHECLLELKKGLARR
jgi:hypothetical protein